LYEKINRIAKPRNARVIIGLESTGHYWYNLFAFLKEKGWEIRVVNPLITKGYSKSDLRMTKTDFISAQLIAEMVCFNKIKRKYYFDKQDAELKELERIRHRLVRNMTRVKVGIQRIIDILFPEYISLWDDPCCLTSIRLLEKYPTPAEMLNAGKDKIDKIIRTYNKTKYNSKKADEILAKAVNTVGTTMMLKPNVVELKFLINQYAMLKTQISEIEQKINTEMEKRDSLLFSIPGVDEVVAAGRILSHTIFLMYTLRNQKYLHTICMYYLIEMCL
jgi:transposase